MYAAPASQNVVKVTFFSEGKDQVLFISMDVRCHWLKDVGMFGCRQDGEVPHLREIVF